MWVESIIPCNAQVACPPILVRKRRINVTLGRRINLIAVMPVAACVVHAVVLNELIHGGGDHVEVPFPGDIVGLQDCDLFHLAPYSK
jgi:hypothetical protein